MKAAFRHLAQFSFDDLLEVMQIEFQFYWENARTHMNRVMKLKPSGGCRIFLAAFVATLASVAQLFAADAAINWSNPADIVYGTPLSSAQQNAAFTNPDTGASLQGTVIYTPLAGTYLNAGSQQALTVTFVPNSNQGVTANAVTKTVFLNVQKAPLTATAPSKTAEYGTAVANYIAGLNGDLVTYSGFVRNENKDSAGAISVKPTIEIKDTDQLTSAGSVKPVTFATPPSSSNYSITTVNGTLTIAQKTLVFDLANKTKLYGENPIAPHLNVPQGTTGDFGLGNGGRGTGWENGQDANVKVSQVHNVTEKSNVGTYDINILLEETTPNILRNYTVKINNAIYTVTKRDLQIAVDPANASIKYGEKFPTFKANYTIIEPGAQTFDIAGVNKTGNALSTASGVLTGAVSLVLPAANANVAKSPHDVKTDGGTAFGNNFNIVRVNGKLTVNKTDLTIKASNRTKITGVALPGIGSLQVEFPNSGDFKFGESPSNIFDPFPPELQYSFVNPNPDPTPGDTTNNADLNVNNGVGAKPGTYSSAIVFKNAGLAAANYNIIQQNGDLNVTLQPLQVSWAPQTTTLTYGDGFDATKHLNAKGTTTVPFGNGTYAIPFTVTYEAFNKDNVSQGAQTPGSTLPAGTFRVTATVKVNQAQINADQNANPAQAPAQVPAFGDGLASLDFIFVKKALEVTAVKQERIFGSTAGFDKTKVTYKGFVLGDTDAKLTKKPEVADPTNAASDVGDYSTIPSGGESGNYSFNYVSSTLKVTPAATSITWNPEAAGADTKKHVTYGTAMSATPNANAAANNGIAGTITYSININDPRALTVPSTDVKATFTPSSLNYAKSELTKTINVLRKESEVAPAGHTLIFGDDIPALSGTVGFLDGDGIETTFKSIAYKGINIGDYLISAEFKDTFGRLKNYNIKLLSAAENRIKIDAATLNIETQDQTSAVNTGGPKTTELKLFGLKAEANVLEGIAMTKAELDLAYTQTGVTVVDEADGNKNKTYDNSKVTLNDAIKNNALLSRVFTSLANIPTMSVPNFSDAKEANFEIKTEVDTKPVADDGDPIAVGSNYKLGTVSNATYGVGKAKPAITWTDKAITYGAAIKTDQLNATVPNPPEGLNNKKGTFVYKIGDANGPDALGAVLESGTYTLHVTYTPHPDFSNQYLSATKTIKLTVNKAQLDVHIPNITNYIYGDPLPVLQAIDLTYGTVVNNNLTNGFVNGDDASIFNNAGSIQPVVAILPALNAKLEPTDFTVANSPSRIVFGQVPVTKNYNIITINGSMTINRRALTVKPADITTPFGMNVPLTLEYINLAPAETAANLSNPGFAFMNPSANIATLAPGTYSTFANGAFGDNYVVTHAPGNLIIDRAIAVINIDNNVHTYDGSTKAVTVTTVPAGLSTTVTYDGNAQPPVNAGSYQVTVTVNDPNYQGTVDGTLVINKAAAIVAVSDTVQVYDGTPKSATVATTPAGLSVSAAYNKNPAGATAAGTYDLMVTVTDPNYTGSAEGAFVVEKATAQIALLNTQQVFDGTPKTVGVQTTPEGLDAILTYNGQDTAPSAVGTYDVTVAISNANYKGTSTGQLTILSAATISLSNTSVPYTGNAQSVTVTTVPAGLKVNVTYNKNPNAPTAAGTYEVVATIEDALYKGSSKDTFKILKATATVQFVTSSLETNWQSTAAAQVTTNPAGLNTVITYNGSTTLPTEPGDYEVVATVVGSNYSGSATATFSIGKAPQVITFPAIPNLTISGQPLLLILNATSDSGLAVNYTVTAGSATINGNVLTVNQPGSVVVTGQQLGNERYLAAEEKVRSFQVSGTGVALGAPQTTASLTDDGDVSLSVSGEPFSTLSVYAADVLTGEFQPVVKIGLDQNGEGTYNTPTNGAERYFQVK
jgi:hypothetical protein